MVTGCTGLVGHGICFYLLNRGFELWGTSRKRLSPKHEKFHPVQLDLTNPANVESLGETMADMDAIIHNAARIPESSDTGENTEDAYFRVNILGTWQLLKLAAMKKTKSFVLISGTAIVDRSRLPINEEAPYYPSNDYHSSKIAAEILCRQYHIERKVDTTILRTQAPYGYRSTAPAVIPRFIDLAQNSKDITLWGTGGRQQVFTFVEDIGLACELAIKKAVSGVFNITGPSAVTMRELAETVLSVYDSSNSKIVYTGKPDPQEGKKAAVSIEKARGQLGYRPRFDLTTGLRQIKERGEGARGAIYEVMN